MSIKTEIKGYKLSTDYKKLWELINNGHRVPAWIIYSKKNQEPIFDLVEVKIKYMGDSYSIGTRGIGYEGFENTFSDFELCCKSNELRFIDINE